jgi:hypothetical protein
VHHRIGPGEDGVNFPARFDFAGDVDGDRYEDLVAYDRCRAYVYYNPLIPVENPFVRGDVNQDGGIDIGDAIAILQHLFMHSGPLFCFDAADCNDDEDLNLADPVYLLMRLFANGPPLPPPAECAPDPAGDTLDCRGSICL